MSDMNSSEVAPLSLAPYSEPSVFVGYSPDGGGNNVQDTISLENPAPIMFTAPEVPARKSAPNPEDGYFRYEKALANAFGISPKAVRAIEKIGGSVLGVGAALANSSPVEAKPIDIVNDFSRPSLVDQVAAMASHADIPESAFHIRVNESGAESPKRQDPTPSPEAVLAEGKPVSLIEYKSVIKDMELSHPEEAKAFTANLTQMIENQPELAGVTLENDQLDVSVFIITKPNGESEAINIASFKDKSFILGRTSATKTEAINSPLFSGRNGTGELSLFWQDIEGKNHIVMQEVEQDGKKGVSVTAMDGTQVISAESRLYEEVMGGAKLASLIPALQYAEGGYLLPNATGLVKDDAGKLFGYVDGRWQEFVLPEEVKDLQVAIQLGWRVEGKFWVQDVVRNEKGEIPLEDGKTIKLKQIKLVQGGKVDFTEKDGTNPFPNDNVVLEKLPSGYVWEELIFEGFNTSDNSMRPYGPEGTVGMNLDSNGTPITKCVYHRSVPGEKHSRFIYFIPRKISEKVRSFRMSKLPGDPFHKVYSVDDSATLELQPK